MTDEERNVKTGWWLPKDPSLFPGSLEQHLLQRIEELRAWVETSYRLALARCKSKHEKEQGREQYNLGSAAECFEILAELDRLLQREPGK